MTMLERIEKKNYTLDMALKWMLQITLAIHYLHERNHIHRDIKPENVFIDEKDDAKLGDLGTISTRLATRSGMGTEGYQAPEVSKAFDEDKDEIFYDDRADIWSLGMIFGELLTGKRLPNKTIQQRFAYTDGVPNSLIDIACKMIIRDFTKRPFVH